jgi:hypothetical protein
MLFGLWIQSIALYTLQRVLDYWYYFLIQNIIEVNLDALLLFDDIACLIEAQLVAFFKLPIVWIVLLNSVVCEMYHRLIY